jgi:hypothetical protein
VRAVVVAGLALVACGGPSAGPDATSGVPDSGAPAPDAATPTGAGTWDDPIVVGALPFRVTGDTTTDGDDRAQRYDCAPTIDEGGRELVMRLELAAPTTLRLGVDDRPDDAIDLDVHAATTPPDADGTVAGCAARANLAVQTELAAGTWWITVDTWRDAGGVAQPGPFTFSIVSADPGECLVNPLPECSEDDTPDVNGVPVEPPGQGGCPAGMTAVDTFCIDRGEPALVDESGEAPAGHSPYANPGGATVRAVSAPGVVPQGYINQTQAAAACALAGKRLCTDAEWLRACQGASTRTFPYGATRVAGACNDARACHPAVQYFESTDSSVFSMIDHPCIGQLPDGLAPTGAHASCASDDGAFDLMGNLHEWTADPAGTFRGGFYVDTQINGDGCLYRTTAHDVSHWDYSTGFRCCSDLP